jgi:hypothetical protein
VDHPEIEPVGLLKPKKPVHCFRGINKPLDLVFRALLSSLTYNLKQLLILSAILFNCFFPLRPSLPLNQVWKEIPSKDFSNLFDVVKATDVIPLRLRRNVR